MRWPWKRAELRRQDFSDQVVSALLAAAQGSPGSVGGLASLETAAGLYSRCLAMAEVQGADIGPDMLACIGREIVTGGEALYALRVDQGGIRFLPAASWDVAGGPDPLTWRYSVQLSGPDGQTQERQHGAGVLHFAWARPAARPWRGLGPLDIAAETARLAYGSTRHLADEANTTRGYLVQHPRPNPSNEEVAIDTDRLQLRFQGGHYLVPSARSQWQGEARGNFPDIYRPIRLGATPDPNLVAVQAAADQWVLNAAGVPPSLFAAAGADTREAFRRFLHSSLAPVGKLVEAELTAKLERPVTLGFEGLFAADLQGRARAYASLVQAEFDRGSAAHLAGLDL